MFWGPIGWPVGVIINIIKKGVVSTLDISRQLGLIIQDDLMAKEDRPKVEGGSKPK